MLHYNLIASLFRDVWLIDPAYAEVMYPYVLGLAESNQTPKQQSDEKLTPYFLSDSGGVIELAGRNQFEGYFDGVPAGSTAVLPIRGALTKYDGWCNTGIQTYMDWIDQAEAASNIASVVLLIDSPGGQANASFMLASRVAGLTKPTLAYVDSGMAASAAYLIGAACNQFYVSTPVDMLGSIGAMIRIADYGSRIQADSPKVWEIYSRLSSEKNADYRRLKENNDPSLIQDMLDEAAGQFIASVKEYRGARLNLTEGDPFKGAVYSATKALKMGLIDGIGSLPVALGALSAYRTKKSDRMNFSTNHTTMSLKQKLIDWLSGQDDEETIEATLESTSEETASEETTATTEAATTVTAQEQAPAAPSLEERLNALEAATTAKDQEIATLKAKLAAKPGAEPTAAVKKEEKLPEAPSGDAELSIFSETDAEVQAIRDKQKLRKPAAKK